QLPEPPWSQDEQVEGEAADRSPERDSGLKRAAGPEDSDAVREEDDRDGQSEQESIVPGEGRDADEQPRGDVRARASLETPRDEEDRRRDDPLADAEVLRMRHEQRHRAQR